MDDGAVGVRTGVSEDTVESLASEPCSQQISPFVVQVRQDGLDKLFLEEVHTGGVASHGYF